MDTVFIPREEDFRRWVREAVQEALERMEASSRKVSDSMMGEPLLSRKEIAKLFQVSLVTLHAWMNRGLPCHKQRGRVYFLRSEVMAHVMGKKEVTDNTEKNEPSERHSGHFSLPGKQR